MGRPLESNDPTSDTCPYDLEFFAKKHGLSRSAAEVILKANGPSRHRCDHAAAAYLQVRHWRETRQKPPAQSIKVA